MPATADPIAESRRSSEAETLPVSAAVTRLHEAIDQQRDLPPNALAAHQLARAARARKARVSDLVEVALADPAIVVRLLRLVNGTSYQTRDRSDVVSMHRAIALMGHEPTSAEAEALRTVADNRAPVKPIVAQAIAQAIFAANFARNLLDTRNPMVSDEGAVTAILSHVPTVLMAMHAPHECCALRAVKKYKPILHDAMFRELFGVDEATLQHEILNAWSLPSTVATTIGRSRQRKAPAMTARDWLPIAVGMANEMVSCVGLEFHADREAALVDIVRRYGKVMDVDTPRLQAMLELSAHDAIRIERATGAPPENQAVKQLLQPYLNRTDYFAPIWELPERLDLTGVISRVQRRPRHSIYAPRRHSSIAPAAAAAAMASTPVDALERLNRVHQDIKEFLPHYEAAESNGLYNKPELLPGESTARPVSRFDRAITRVGPFLFDGLQMAMGFEGIAFYTCQSNEDAFVPAWLAPEPVSFSKNTGIRIDGDDLISKAANNRVDAHIANSSTEKVQSSLPSWFRSRHPHCRSFVFLPLVNDARNRLRGFIIAERHVVDKDGISKDCIAKMRLLRDTFNEVLSRAERA